MSSHILTLFRKVWRKVRDAVRPSGDDGMTFGEIVTSALSPAMVEQIERQNAFMQALQDKANRQANPQRYVEPVFDWTKVSYDPARGLVTEKPVRAVSGRCSLCGASVPGPDFRCSEHCLNGRA